MFKQECRELEHNYAEIARAYFKLKKVYRYNTKKIADMDDREVIQKCHFWYTDNNLIEDYRAFEDAQLND